MNTPELVGECGYVDKDYPSLFIPDRLWQASFFKNTQVDAQWLTYLLNIPALKKKIKSEATGTSDSMKNISKPALLSTNLLLPKPAEQRAIAQTLSDIDAELDALEQRRAKYQAIKQGIMQQLLTGKIRLSTAFREQSTSLATD